MLRPRVLNEMVAFVLPRQSPAQVAFAAQMGAAEGMVKQSSGGGVSGSGKQEGEEQEDADDETVHSPDRTWALQPVPTLQRVCACAEEQGCR
jgi:hypothetical protein